MTLPASRSKWNNMFLCAGWLPWPLQLLCQVSGIFIWWPWPCYQYSTVLAGQPCLHRKGQDEPIKASLCWQITLTTSATVLSKYFWWPWPCYQYRTVLAGWPCQHRGQNGPIRLLCAGWLPWPLQLLCQVSHVYIWWPCYKYSTVCNGRSVHLCVWVFGTLTFIVKHGYYEFQGTSCFSSL